MKMYAFFAHDNIMIYAGPYGENVFSCTVQHHQVKHYK